MRFVRWAADGAWQFLMIVEEDTQEDPFKYLFAGAMILIALVAMLIESSQ